MKKTETIASIIGLFLCLATYWGTLYLPKFPTPLAGPEFFPRLLAILLGGLSLALLFKTLRKSTPSAKGNGGDEATPRERVFWKMVLAMGSSVLYFLGLSIFGFMLCTFLYFAFLMFLMQSKKRILKTVIWSLATTIVTYLGFGILLKATLPIGTIFR